MYIMMLSSKFYLIIDPGYNPSVIVHAKCCVYYLL